MSMAEELRAELLLRGATLVGFADMIGFEYPFGISIALSLDRKILSGIKDNPTKDYEGEYERANAKLDELSYLGEKFLINRGFRAKAFPATAHSYDSKELCAPLQHKTTAVKAGLGWIGKLDLLVTESFGSGVRFASILTDMPVENDEIGKPITESKCGSCSSCADACPADASRRVNWRHGMSRSDLVDIFACNDSITHRVKQLGLRRAICGICIVSCPYTRRYINEDSCS